MDQEEKHMQRSYFEAISFQRSIDPLIKTLIIDGLVDGQQLTGPT